MVKDKKWWWQYWLEIWQLQQTHSLGQGGAGSGGTREHLEGTESGVAEELKVGGVSCHCVWESWPVVPPVLPNDSSLSALNNHTLWCLLSYGDLKCIPEHLSISLVFQARWISRGCITNDHEVSGSYNTNLPSCGSRGEMLQNVSNWRVCPSLRCGHLWEQWEMQQHYSVYHKGRAEAHWEAVPST